MERVRKEVEAYYAYERGYYGEGVGVAVLDSGIAWKHPDLAGRVIYARSFGRAGESIGTGDILGHGTHVSGIIGGSGAASNGRYQGMAPKCTLMSLKVLNHEGKGRVGDVVEAIHWLCENGSRYGIRLVNLSMGGVPEQKDAEQLIRSVERLWKMGFLVCVAAGNEGPKSQSITVPGTICDVITVGACDDERPIQMGGKRKVNYSGRGPAKDCECKPDVVAPGYRILSCNAGWKQGKEGYYCAKSGTSMATPVVCGALALLLSRDQKLTNIDAKQKLLAGCKDLGYQKNRQGFGMVRIPDLFSVQI